jgi:hypothetical protein
MFPDVGAVYLKYAKAKALTFFPACRLLPCKPERVPLLGQARQMAAINSNGFPQSAGN